MDETTYSDPEVIDLVNRLYVPVRVDNDRHPDINRRYNQWGWPTTAFLSSRGALLAGATYIPPERMRLVLRRISELYALNRRELEDTPPVMEVSPPERENLTPSLVEKVASSILTAWDREFGGLGAEPKFPHPEALTLALHAHRRGMGEEYLALVRESLEAMIYGNLRDRLEGGFFRYSTTRDWSVPHYEKMLADNAGLLSVLLRVYGATGKRLYLDTAKETAAFIQRTLSDGRNRFFGSQDADEEYYLLPRYARRARPAPPVDRTVYLDLSARAASSMLEAGTVLGNESYRRLSLGFLDFAWQECYLPEVGMAHYHDGSPRRHGLLDDQVETALAFQTAFSLTGKPLYLERAEDLLTLVRRHFWDGERKLLLDTTEGLSLPGLRPATADTASASRAAECMLRQYFLGGEAEWLDLAAELLSSVAGDSLAGGYLAAPFALALDLLLEGPLVVKIAGGDPEARGAFLSAAVLSPDHRVIPLLEEGESGEPRSAGVEVCGREACFLRTGRLEELSTFLGLTWGIIMSKDEEEPGSSRVAFQEG